MRLMALGALQFVLLLHCGVEEEHQKRSVRILRLGFQHWREQAETLVRSEIATVTNIAHLSERQMLPL
jgi:hypothetical protein